MFPQPLPFPFSHLKKGNGMKVLSGKVILQNLSTDHALRFQYLIVGFFRNSEVFP